METQHSMMLKKRVDIIKTQIIFCCLDTASSENCRADTFISFISCRRLGNNLNGIKCQEKQNSFPETKIVFKLNHSLLCEVWCWGLRADL